MCKKSINTHKKNSSCACVCVKVVSGEIETTVLLQFTVHTTNNSCGSGSKTRSVVTATPVAAAKSCDHVIMAIHVDAVFSSAATAACLLLFLLLLVGRGFVICLVCFFSADGFKSNTNSYYIYKIITERTTVVAT